MKFFNTKAFTTRVLVSLALAAASLAGLSGSAEAANCLSCHAPVGSTTDIRPVESTYRNITTGSIKGSHAKHIVSPTLDANTCTPCHGAASTSYQPDHRNGLIEVPIVGYSKTASFPQSGSTTIVLGTCSTASCHADPYSAGTVVTPVWGVTSGCASCHTGANVITASGPATGNHALTGHVVACTSCHAAGATATVAPSTGHNDGNIDIANVGYLTLNKTKGTAGTTCSAASCHASPVAASLVVTPAWGTTGNGCAACHTGVNVITASGPATGNHALAGHVVACTACHAAGTTATAAPTLANGHNDGNIDVANVGYLTLNKTKGTAGTTCSAASCHASPVAATLIVTPAWGTTGNGCAACHTGVNVITASGPATGNHALAGHVVACTSCHEASTTATIAPTVGHADGNIDVANVGYLTLNKTKGTAGTTCSAASCHASPVAATLIVTPAWGTTGNGCAACHAGVNVITATGPATGNHALAGHVVACTACHEANTTATIAPTVGHADGNIDVANVGYLTLNKTKGTAGTTCSAAFCHASPVAATLVVTPAWGTTGNGCAACHAGVNVITASGPATGSHAKHGMAACTACHAAGSTATVVPSAGHNDGNIDVANVGYTLNKTKGTAGVSCSTSVCHGSTSPAWGTTGALTNNDACTTCHGTETVTITAANRVVIAPSDATATDTGKVSANAKTGAHQTHLTFLNGLSNQGTQDSRCNDCHGALPVSASHANGSSSPTFQGLATHSGTMTASFSAGSCSNTYCHNPAAVGGTLNSVNAGTGINPSWTNAAYVADGTLKTQTNCGTCHKSPGDAGFTSTTTHAANITQDCAGCHGHNGAPGGIAGQQHMDGTLFGSGNCDSCHGYQAGSWVAAPAINAEGKGAHESHIVYLTTKRFGTTIAMNPAADQYASAATTWTNVCGICHDNGTALHKDGTVNVAMNASQAYVFGPTGTVATYNGLPGRLAANDKTCSNISCHYFTTPVWSTY